MKCLFVHDVKFIEVGNKYYTTNLSSAIWEKQYLNFFDKLIVVGRGIKADFIEPNKYVLSNNDGVEFMNTICFSFPFSYFIKRDKIKKDLQKAMVLCDCVIIRLPSFLGLLAVKMANKMQKPYLVEYVGCTWSSLWYHSIKGKCVAIPIYILTRKIIRESKYVLYVTEKFLQEVYPTKGRSCGCSDVNIKEVSEDILDLRLKRFENNCNPLILGTVGAVNVKYKGQHYVIKAISKLKKEGFNFKYSLVGGGDTSYLKKVAQKYGVANDVEFLGSISHDKIFDFLDGVDIYIQPSTTEGLPRAIIEAMSRACPIIGSNVGGIPELVSQDGIFKRGNINDICKVLRNFTKEKLQNEAQRSFQVSKKYSPELLNKKRNDFYKLFAKEVNKK